VKNTPSPSNVYEVHQFLGLCNFFSAMCATLYNSLLCLLPWWKNCNWKGGSLPSDTLQAFLELQSYLCSEPMVDYPHRNCPYALIFDASLRDDKRPGSLGAILTKLNWTANTASSLMPVASFKSTNVTTLCSDSRCKLLFGVWNTLLLIYKAESSH